MHAGLFCSLFLLSADFFFFQNNYLFQRFFQEYHQRQTVWIQIRSNVWAVVSTKEQCDKTEKLLKARLKPQHNNSKPRDHKVLKGSPDTEPTGLDKLIFSAFVAYVLGAQKNRLIEMVLLSTHNIVLVEK